MTPMQKRLAIADTGFVALWLLMNFFWMWSAYRIAIPLALPCGMFAGATLLFTERTTAATSASWSNVAWFLKDYYWMLENSGRLPSGLHFGTFFFAATLACAIIALVAGGAAGTFGEAVARIKRMHMLIRRT